MEEDLSGIPFMQGLKRLRPNLFEDLKNRLNENKTDVGDLLKKASDEIIAIAGNFAKIIDILNPPESMIEGFVFVLDETVEASLKPLRLEIEARSENVFEIIEALRKILRNPQTLKLNVDEANSAVKKVCSSVEYANKMLEDEKWFSQSQPSGEYKEIQDSYKKFAYAVNELLTVARSIKLLNQPPEIKFIQIE